MRLKTWSYTPADDDTDGYVNDGTGDGAAATLLTTSPGDGLAHLVIATPSGSVSGNYTIVGTNADGVDQTVTLATDTVNPVTTTAYFKTVTSITLPTTGAETVDIGWTDDVIGPTIPIDPKSGIAAAISVDISGTISFTIQEMWKNVYDVTSPSVNGPWLNISALASKAADTASTANIGSSAIRLVLNSLTAGATIAISVSQPTSWGN